MTEEIWKVVPSFPNYEASSRGRIRCVFKAKTGPHPQPTYGRVTSNGYHHVFVRCGQKRRFVTVHSLVAEAFHGSRPLDQVIMHIDETRTNNRPENLRYGTRTENANSHLALARNRDAQTGKKMQPDARARMAISQRERRKREAA